MSDHMGIVKYGARLAYKQHIENLKALGYRIRTPSWDELEDYIKQAWIKAIHKLYMAK
jgi:hypothetical protein